MPDTATKPLKFDLAFRKEAYQVVGPQLVRDEARDDKLPDTPPGFVPSRGDHTFITNRADILNKVQRQSGYVDYFFFPQIAGVPVNYDGAKA